MTTAKNDITGDSIATRKSTDAYRDGWDKIFSKKSEEKKEEKKEVIKIDKPKRK